ncbi:hypothetical protein L6164_025803 [Bauhinia variegata]|uniref:Uncharacterized protein n=1 Tax=Bauhinia variegata TaxID=167791 RepID=A0ACB9M376_BAUVA|nr:hypothetical protein L6164_025803 [Bauhinia variegata]
MADAQRSKSGAGSRQPSRLQRRAPSSLQINRSCEWNVAIPLLSPLATSPTAVEQKPAPKEDSRQQEARHQSAEAEKVVFKTWQHPAAPFCYEPASLVRPFVPV